MITPEFLKSCTDEQINKGVAWLVTKSDPSKFGAAFLHGVIFNDEFYPTKYCTNPNYAWPIILENKISIMDWINGWEASIDFHGTHEVHSTDEMLSMVVINSNPLRAAMEVYILMSTKS